MIKLRDTLTLAGAKLRTKKILLICTIIVSSLIFGIVILGITVFRGSESTMKTYLDKATNNQKMLSVTPVIPDRIYSPIKYDDTLTDEQKTELDKIEKQYINEQKTLAAKYGMTFDEDSVEHYLSPNPMGDKDKYGNVIQYTNSNSPAYGIYAKNKAAQWIASATNKISDLKNLAVTKYGAISVNDETKTAAISGQTARYMAGGQDNIEELLESQGPSGDMYSNPITQSGYFFINDQTISQYILPVNEKREQNKTAIPVVVTKDEIVKVFGKQLGLSKEPSSDADKVKWMNDLKQKVNGLTYDVCYRNKSEINLLQTAARQKQNLALQSQPGAQTTTAGQAGSASTDSMQLMYNLPTVPCSPVTVAKDERSTALKQFDLNQQKYQRELGEYSDPVTEKLTFQIVGVMPKVEYSNQNSNDLKSLADSLLTPEYGAGAFIPTKMYSQLLNVEQLRPIMESNNDAKKYAMLDVMNYIYDSGLRGTIVAFKDTASAKAFINDSRVCSKDGCKHQWDAQPYGINFLLLDDITNKVTDLAKKFMPLILLVAAIILCFTMSRVIIDSRHETAVFRALGAKRIDIVRVYMTYSIIVAILIMVVALVIGLGGATVLNVLYAQPLTDYAMNAYGVYDLPKFNLFGFDLALIGLVLLTILVVSLVAVSLPLLRNVRRNQVKDLREE